MNNLIGIIAGDPESINSEIIAKAWKNAKIRRRWIEGESSKRLAKEYYKNQILSKH